MYQYLVPDGISVWEGLGGVALREEVCHWGRPLRFQKAVKHPQGAALCLLLIHQDVSSCHRAFAPPLWLYGSELHTQLHAFFYKLLWSWCFVTETERKQIQ